jgi:hypothetical protein
MQESCRPRETDTTVTRLRSLWSELSWLSRGNSPTSITPILYPIAIALFVVAGLPSVLICGLLWTGYSLSRRRKVRPDHEGAGGPRLVPCLASWLA